ncbi:cytochrome P450 [Aspergillus stella-maris]|uniref:cytochrome P450 n=1 Tax=Aspergillus stella-maris TaxID=1810926 RepID=UPI003CCDF0A0
MFEISNLKYALVVSVAIIAALLFVTRTKTLRCNTPPGPKPLPILGNFLDLPPKGTPEYQHWLKHKYVYGSVSSITVMGTIMVIFHDKDAAHAVLGKKAQRTSVRPRLNFAQLCGFENFLTTHEYNAKYRLHRKMVAQGIGTKGLAARFRPIQEKESLRFILQILHRPDDVLVHLKT